MKYRATLWLTTFLLAFAAVAAMAATRDVKTPLNATDQHFLHEAIMANMSEVQLGHLALKKSSSDDVRKFAQEMVNDHSHANGKFVRTAGRKNVVPPPSVGAENLKTYERLNAMSGDAFDRAFIQDMVKDHMKDVADFKKAVNTVQDADLLALARETLPVLEHHLEMARDLANNMPNGS